MAKTVFNILVLVKNNFNKFHDLLSMLRQINDLKIFAMILKISYILQSDAKSKSKN